MKIKDRLEKLAEDGYITPEAIEKAQEKGWITAKEQTDMVKMAEEKVMVLMESRGLMNRIDEMRG